MISSRFMIMVRRYAVLEERFNKDFSAPIIALAHQEVDSLEAFGMTRDEATSMVNEVLAVQVKRFPVQIFTDDLPF